MQPDVTAMTAMTKPGEEKRRWMEGVPTQVPRASPSIVGTNTGLQFPPTWSSRRGLFRPSRLIKIQPIHDSNSPPRNIVEGRVGPLVLSREMFSRIMGTCRWCFSALAAREPTCSLESQSPNPIHTHAGYGVLRVTCRASTALLEAVLGPQENLIPFI
jgi:hypothetical protein